MSNSNLLTGLLTLAISGLAFFQSRPLTFLGRVFVDWTLFILGILGVSLVIKGLFTQGQDKTMAGVKGIGGVWLTIFGLSIYLMLIPVLGFIIASTAWFTLSGVLLSPRSKQSSLSTWWRSFGVGLLVTFIFYVLFKLALAVPLPGGVLGIG